MYFDLRNLKLAAALAVIPVAVAIYATSGEAHRTWTTDEVPIAFWAWKTATPTSDETKNAATIFLRAELCLPSKGKEAQTRPVHYNQPVILTLAQTDLRRARFGFPCPNS